MDGLIDHFAQHGDLAHMALFLWAMGSSTLLIWALRELVAATRRFDRFVSEIARLNQLFRDQS